MAYRRKKAYRKKRGGNPGARYGAAAGSMAYKAYQLATKLARFVNTESKYLPYNAALTTSNAGAIYSMSLLATGNTEITRTGSSIKPQRISGRMYVVGNAAIQSMCRVMIFKWKQSNGVLPLVADLVDTGSQLWMAGKNHNNRFESKVVYDRLFGLCNTGQNNYVVNINIKCEGHIQYNGTTAAEGSLDDGGYYMFIATDVGANFPQVYCDLRMTFVDN